MSLSETYISPNPKQHNRVLHVAGTSQKALSRNLVPDSVNIQTVLFDIHHGDRAQDGTVLAQYSAVGSRDKLLPFL